MGLSFGIMATLSIVRIPVCPDPKTSQWCAPTAEREESDAKGITVYQQRFRIRDERWTAAVP